MNYAALLTLCLTLAAQDAQFGARSRLVLVPVTVTDAKGRVVDGLGVSDFVLLDRGRPQQITVDTIATGVAPIALIVAVQSSGISEAVLEKVQKIGGLIQPLITAEHGCAGLVSFAERIQWLQDCTTDGNAVEHAFQKLRPGDYKRARLLDASLEAVEHLRRQPNSRRILLLISESKDRNSKAELKAVTAAAEAADVTIYAATYSAFKTAFTSRSGGNSRGSRITEPAVPNPNHTQDGDERMPDDPRLTSTDNSADLLAGIGELKRLNKTETTRALTVSTGGVTFPFARQRALEEAIEKLGAELHSQYVISFSPSVTHEPGYHRLEVHAGGGALQVRARPGYWSALDVP